ncbi:MAG: replication-relaxation family protein [Propionibacteriales bacterium]|nr:replication-relaxation family protein [Propionibacteriales bacterium]
MNAHLVAQLLDQVDERDLAILRSLERFRLLTTRHIEQLHFAGHASRLAGARACTRTLQRLYGLGFIAPLTRRIGGVRKGSASYVWHLAATGERLLHVQDGRASRRRYVEPGLTFLNHTLAVTDLAIGILTAARNHSGLAVEQLITEPANWRRYLGPHGETAWLKPDLHVITSSVNPGDIGAAHAAESWEEHAFLEVDLGTEHLPRIQAKCRAYAAYYATGAYQAEHHLFPAVVWLSADTNRRRALRAAISAAPGLPALFRVTSPRAYVTSLLSGDGDPNSNQSSGGQNGGTPS